MMIDGEAFARRGTTATTLIALAVIVAGCAGGAGRKPDQRPPAPIESSAAREYRLGTGDLVSVDIRDNSDLSVQVPVRPDGHISVPLIGDVTAVRRTPAEIAADAERELRRFLRTPAVSITVAALDSVEFRDRVRVAGGVDEPKSLPYRDGMSVVDLILEAGGVGEFAYPEKAWLYRGGARRRAYPVLLDSILVKGVLDTNYRLEPGDLVFVPERRF